MLNSTELKRTALEVGFDACGIARAEALTDEEYPLRLWLERQWHGELGYMERNADKRMDPRLLLPGARSVVCLVSAYGPPDPSRTDGVAAYAQRRDYHEVVKSMLRTLMNRLDISGKPCCDTVPISDKHWAARAGLGFVGRHTLLVTPKWGTWVNLGEIVTTEECDAYDSPSPLALHPPCRSCGRCVAACPNGALATEGAPMLDVRRCTAYYTTHHPRPLPPTVDPCGYTLGCDLCQLACPYNAQAASLGSASPRPAQS